MAVNFGMPRPQDLMFGQGAPISGYGLPQTVTSDVVPGMSGVDFGSNLPTIGTMPEAGGGGMFAGMSGLNKAQLALGGINTIGGLWAAFQSAKMAKKQFNFTKKTTEANMANQIQSYNTTLGDRARSRAVVEGQDAATSQAYVDKNKLPAYRG